MKLLVTFLLVVVSFTLSHSQSLKRLDLSTEAKAAYDKGDFFQAATKLYAFKEINRRILETTEREKLVQINTVIEFCKNALKSYEVIVSSSLKGASLQRNGVTIIEGKNTPFSELLKESIKINGVDYQIKSLGLEKTSELKNRM